jgi:dolichyl-phosphate beta-glucosyltransferase
MLQQESGAMVIVVPCFNEAKRLDGKAFREYVQHHSGTDFLFVDDGSRDETFSVLEGLAAGSDGRLRVLRLEQNQGKAEAVRRGLTLALQSAPRVIGYWDADLATPLDAIEELAAVLASERIEVVMGARVALLGREIDRRPLRHYAGRLFATAASLTLNLPVYDTQCGAKLLRVTPRLAPMLERPFSSRWIFDVELLARFLSSGGASRSLYEFPLRIWTDVGESKVKVADFVRAFGEMLRIYREYPLGQPLRSVVAPLTGIFARYLGVGAVGTGVHYLVLASLVEGFDVTAPTAAAVGATLGAVVNYVLNYHLTFQSKVSHRRAMPRFAVVAVVGMLMSALGVNVGTTVGIHYALAQLVCTVLTLAFGFIINRAWTF